MGDDTAEPTLQLAFHLLHAAFPAKVLHLQRVYPQATLMECQEMVDDKTRAMLANWVQLPHIDAERWRIAGLPYAQGGLLWPQLQEQGPMTRAVSLYRTSRDDDRVATRLTQMCREEQPRLLDQCAELMGQQHKAIGALDSKPTNVKANSLNRTVRTLSFNHQCVQLEQSLAPHSQCYRAWTRHSMGWRQALPHKPVNLSDWMTAKPVNQQLALSNAEFRYGLQVRLASPVCQEGLRCTAVRAGQVCNQELDCHGEHAQRCPAISKIWRHNGVRDQLAAYAKSAHLHCEVEQRLPWNRATADVRSLKTADIMIESTAGLRIWGDVRVCTAPKDVSVSQYLVTQERQKVMEYGQEDNRKLDGHHSLGL